MPVKSNVSVKLYLLLFIAAASLIGLGLYGIKELAKMDANTQTLYVDRVVPFQELSNVRYKYNTEIIPIAQKVKSHSITFTEAENRVRAAKQLININWHNYELTYLTPQEIQLLKQANSLKKNVDEACLELLSALAKRNEAALDGVIKNRFSADPDPFVIKVSELMTLQVTVGKQIFDSNNKIYHNTSKKFSLIIVLSLLTAIVLSLIIIGNIKKLIRDILKSNTMY